MNKNEWGKRIVHIYKQNDVPGRDVMKFIKMQGLGNDFICLDGKELNIEEILPNISSLCDRHYGVGADGIILIKDSDKADRQMEIYNADGTRAKMCGNGIRCVGKYLYENSMDKDRVVYIETDTGIRELRFVEEENMIQVDMGSPCLETRGIPVLGEKDIILNQKIEVSGETYRFTAVSMGNPHAVVFVKNPDRICLERTGPAFEYHPLFPDRINVEFVRVRNHAELEMRVWERGVGETLSCGTGACAATVAAVLNNLTDDKVKVKLKGGNLFVRWNRKVNRVYMTGPAVKVFDGEI